MRNEAQVKYFNSVSGSHATAREDAEDAYWAKLLADGGPAAVVPNGSITNAKVSATAAIDLSKLADVAAGTDGLDAGTLQATLQALATRIAVLEAV